jgi:hypothetical protein
MVELENMFTKKKFELSDKVRFVDLNNMKFYSKLLFLLYYFKSVVIYALLGFTLFIFPRISSVLVKK